MSCFLLDKNISILLVSMDLFPEQELFVLLRDNPIFTRDFIEYIFRCKSSKRRVELLLSRLLFAYILQTHNVNIQFFNSINKKEDLLINNNFSSPERVVYLSISHTHSWIAIAANLISRSVIDIESPQREIGKIKLFFTKKFGFHSPVEEMFVLSLWTVYEALLKLSVSQEFKKRVLETTVLGLKKSIKEVSNSPLYLCIPVDNYKILIWRDKVIPELGCIITSKTNHQKIKFYIVEKTDCKKEKPCKRELTRLLTFKKKLEINF